MNRNLMFKTFVVHSLWVLLWSAPKYCLYLVAHVCQPYSSSEFTSNLPFLSHNWVQLSSWLSDRGIPRAFHATCPYFLRMRCLRVAGATTFFWAWNCGERSGSNFLLNSKPKDHRFPSFPVGKIDIFLSTSLSSLSSLSSFMFDLHRISDFFLRRVDVEGETAALLGSRSWSSCSAFTLAVLASRNYNQNLTIKHLVHSCSISLIILIPFFTSQRSSFSIPCGGKLNSCLAHLSIFTTGSSELGKWCLWFHRASGQRFGSAPFWQCPVCSGRQKWRERNSETELNRAANIRCNWQFQFWWLFLSMSTCLKCQEGPVTQKHCRRVCREPQRAEHSLPARSVQVTEACAEASVNGETQWPFLPLQAFSLSKLSSIMGHTVLLNHLGQKAIKQSKYIKIHIWHMYDICMTYVHCNALHTNHPPTQPSGSGSRLSSRRGTKISASNSSAVSAPSRFLSRLRKASQRVASDIFRPVRPATGREDRFR